jgi:pyruvate-formate lyase-activating enzyme
VDTYYLWDEKEGDPGAEWVKLKRRVSYGDQQDMAGSIVKSIVVPDGATDAYKEQLKRSTEFMLDVSNDGPFRLLVLIVDWNLKDRQGKDVALTMESIKLLDTEYAKELHRIASEHEVQHQGKEPQKP